MVDTTSEYFMQLALKEARKGFGRTSPNPCVGAVIVKDNEVIATGYHKKAGTPHAEIHALQKAGERAVNADMYVTLEPCNHHGRTAPCSHAVACSGIKRVVVGMRDPNPLVDGSGVDYLQESGVEVVCGVLEDECRDINKPFIKYITSSLPWVIMKAGLSLDGKLNYRGGAGGKITGDESFKKVHRLRNSVDAILVGSGTVAADDPSLTTRLPRKHGKNPVRIVLDSQLEISKNAQILDVDMERQTWVFCSETVNAEKMQRLTDRGISVIPITPGADKRLNLEDVLKFAAVQEITTLLVEGGATVHGAFLQQRLVDYAYLFYAPIFAGDGGVSLISGLQVNGGRDNAIKLSGVKTRRYGEDWLVQGDVVYPD